MAASGLMCPAPKSRALPKVAPAELVCRGTGVGESTGMVSFKRPGSLCALSTLAAGTQPVALGCVSPDDLTGTPHDAHSDGSCHECRLDCHRVPVGVLVLQQRSHTRDMRAGHARPCRTVAAPAVTHEKCGVMTAGGAGEASLTGERLLETANLTLKVYECLCCTAPRWS